MTETDGSASRLARQELWRKRLAEAESRYHDTVVCLQVLVEAGTVNESARANRAAARTEYLRILRIFTDLVLRDIDPAGEADSTPGTCQAARS